MLGAYVVPVGWHYTLNEERHLFSESGAKAIVIHADQAGPMRETLPADVAVMTSP